MNTLFHRFQVGDMIRLKVDPAAPMLLVVGLGQHPFEAQVFDPDLKKTITVPTSGYELAKPASLASMQEALRVQDG